MEITEEKQSLYSKRLVFLAISRYKLFFISIIFVVICIFPYYLFDFFKEISFSLFPWFRTLIAVEFMYDINCSLLLIPILFSSLFTSGYQKIIIWIFCLLVGFNHILSYSPDWSSFFNNLLFMSLPPLVSLLIKFNLEWRKQERQHLFQREQERKTYISNLFKAHETERKRIAQELHDGTIPELIVSANHLQRIITRKEPTALKDIREELYQIKNDILCSAEDLRRVSIDLRPGILEHLGLIPAIRWLVERLEQDSGVKIRLIIEGDEIKFPNDEELLLFRVIQEAFNNIRCHSNATEATVFLEYSSNSLIIEITDNGRGFDQKMVLDNLAMSGKLGIRGMEERVQSMNGIFGISSVPGDGTKITIKL